MFPSSHNATHLEIDKADYVDALLVESNLAKLSISVDYNENYLKRLAKRYRREPSKLKRDILLTKMGIHANIFSTQDLDQFDFDSVAQLKLSEKQRFRVLDWLKQELQIDLRKPTSLRGQRYLGQLLAFLCGVAALTFSSYGSGPKAYPFEMTYYLYAGALSLLHSSKEE